MAPIVEPWENCSSDLRVRGERKEELRGRWEVKEPSKDLGKRWLGASSSVYSLLSVNWRGLGYIVRGEADRWKVISRNVIWVGSRFWKILLFFAGG